MEETKNEITNKRMFEENYKSVSDTVIIEIVHAFKEIIIELINKKYGKSV